MAKTDQFLDFQVSMESSHRYTLGGGVGGNKKLGKKRVVCWGGKNLLVTKHDHMSLNRPESVSYYSLFSDFFI